MKRASRRKYHYIYKITRIYDGKYYIGMHSTDNLNDGYFGSGTYLSRSILKHGLEHHQKEILEYCKSRELLKLKESELVNKNLLTDNLCMNLVPGGNGGFLITPEVRLKMSLAAKNRIVSDETRQKMSLAQKKRIYTKGHFLSDEHKQNIGKALLGSRRTDEQKLRMSQAQSNRSEEWRQNLSQSLTGRKLSKKHIENTSKGLIGNIPWNKGLQGKYVHSEESKRKISESNIGKHHGKRSEEAKLKMSIAAKNRKRRGHSEETKKKISEANNKRFRDLTGEQ